MTPIRESHAQAKRRQQKLRSAGFFCVRNSASHKHGTRAKRRTSKRQDIETVNTHAAPHKCAAQSTGNKRASAVSQLASFFKKKNSHNKRARIESTHSRRWINVKVKQVSNRFFLCREAEILVEIKEWQEKSKSKNRIFFLFDNGLVLDTNRAKAHCLLVAGQVLHSEVARYVG